MNGWVCAVSSSKGAKTVLDVVLIRWWLMQACLLQLSYIQRDAEVWPDAVAVYVFPEPEIEPEALKMHFGIQFDRKGSPWIPETWAATVSN